MVVGVLWLVVRLGLVYLEEWWAVSALTLARADSGESVEHPFSQTLHTPSLSPRLQVLQWPDARHDCDPVQQILQENAPVVEEAGLVCVVRLLPAVLRLSVSAEVLPVAIPRIA